MPQRINARHVLSPLTHSFLVVQEVQEVPVVPVVQVDQEVQVVQEVQVDLVRVELPFASTHHCTPFQALPSDPPSL